MSRYAILLVAIVRFFAVSAGKSDILKNVTTESWMSMENFTSLIKFSYSRPECVNIFICDESPGTQRLFKQFISIYPYPYTLNGISYGCDCFFIVASSAETSKPTIDTLETFNTNIETLIVIDDDVVDEPIGIEDGYILYGIFETGPYTETDVNIAARNGLWTLSGNFNYPRVFTMVSRYEDMMHTNGIINCQGEMIVATTFYNPPFCFLHSVVNRTVREFESEIFIAEDESELDGVELKLFLLFAQRMNFTYEFRKPEGIYRFGRRNGTRWNGGVIGQMVDGHAEIAFGGIPLIAEYNMFTNMTTPWRQIDLNFLVPRPKPHASFWALTKPFKLEVWTTILAMLIVQSVCVYARSWINPKIPKRFRSFTKTWTEMMGRLLGTSAPRNIHGLELGFQFWHFIGILMVTAYSSSLAARLARRDYDKRIDTLQDFIAANLTWGRQGPVPIFSNFFDHSDRYAAQLPSRFKHEMNESERHEKILKGNYAIFGNLVSSAFFPNDNVSNADLKGYRLMRDSVGHYYVSFAVVFWLVESVDRLMLWMQETGLVQYHLNDVLHRRMSFALREVLIEQDINNGERRVLELMPLGVGFVLYLGGLFISTVVFYLELRSVRGSRTIREVLLDIKKKREIRQAKESEKRKMYSALKKFKRKRYGFDRSRNNRWMKDMRRSRLAQMKTFIP